MVDPAKVLAGLPNGLRAPLIQHYKEIASNFSEHRWEPSELNGGKFCEVAYCIIHGALKQSFPARPSKPKNMLKDCRALEVIPANSSLVGDRSLRILIPRVLIGLYDIRNNRGVGHVGGDVDPNFLDASTVFGMASWVLAELVRIFHDVSTKEAQETVDALVERKIPLIWDTGEGVKRVLNPDLPKNDQVLLLLYQNQGWELEKDLNNWVEYSSLSMFRTRILKPLHKARLIEYDQAKSRARISPSGAVQVEERLIHSGEQRKR